MRGGFKTQTIRTAENLSADELEATRQEREEARQALAAQAGCK